MRQHFKPMARGEKLQECYCCDKKTRSYCIECLQYCCDKHRAEFFGVKEDDHFYVCDECVDRSCEENKRKEKKRLREEDVQYFFFGYDDEDWWLESDEKYQKPR